MFSWGLTGSFSDWISMSFAKLTMASLLGIIDTVLSEFLQGFFIRYSGHFVWIQHEFIIPGFHRINLWVIIGHSIMTIIIHWWQRNLFLSIALGNSLITATSSIENCVIAEARGTWWHLRILLERASFVDTRETTLVETLRFEQSSLSRIFIHKHFGGHWFYFLHVFYRFFRHGMHIARPRGRGLFGLNDRNMGSFSRFPYAL